MRVFVTGATGFVGSAVVNELLKAKHEVIGFARSEESEKKLLALGVRPHRGDITDLESVRAGAKQANAVIHTAFNHDFSKFKENCENDQRLIDAVADVLRGSNRSFVITSGTALAGQGQMSNEDSVPVTVEGVPRILTEVAATKAAESGVNVNIVRLPPTVHGDGDHGFVSRIIEISKERGAAAYIGNGENLWPAVHRLDAAKIYKLALDKAIPGARYHAVAEEGIPFKKIAEVVGRKLGLPVKSLTKEEAAAHFTWFVHFASFNAPSSSRKTRELLGWKPEHVDLLTDLEKGTYFK